MTSVCFYFQVHQPFRLKHYSFFNLGYDTAYADEELNRKVLDKVATKCYLPMNDMLLRMIHKHKSKFKIAFSISGVALDQFEQYRPDVITSFQKLAATGCVEFLAETYYHSLSFLFSATEFRRQVSLHSKKIVSLFKQKPQVFRNTELITNNHLAELAGAMGMKAIVCEGVDRLLAGRSPNFVYRTKSQPSLPCLLKNYKLSDDIAFRFQDKGWSEFPLTADKFAHWLGACSGDDSVNLFMDYETFGEHQWAESGIFNFMEHLPEAVLANNNFCFKMPKEVIASCMPKDIYDIHQTISWADTERDLSAWLGNALQDEALRRVATLENDIRAVNVPELTDAWANLLTSDHFYYMCTKYWNDGDVHKYFSPYDSPFYAYNNYINIIQDLELRVEACKKSKVVESRPDSSTLLLNSVFVNQKM